MVVVLERVVALIRQDSTSDQGVDVSFEHLLGDLACVRVGGRKGGREGGQGE